MPKSLLIVESPTKARTLQKYLGGEIKVLSSKGHIKDLPPNELGVDLEHDFAPRYVTILGKAKVIQELKKAAADTPEIFLGPDPDREGEAIAWHIAESLGEQHRFHRVLFLELTPRAIKEALANPVPLRLPAGPAGPGPPGGLPDQPAVVAEGQNRPERRAGAVRGFATGV
jgi:DNA topoisomerase-1